ncbi:unnamed protein product, partial [Rotaria magnacalcarata]
MSSTTPTASNFPTKSNT